MPIQSRLTAALFLVPALLCSAPGAGLDPSVFKNPPAEYRCYAMDGFDMAKVNAASVIADVDDMAKNKRYGGFFLTAFHANGSDLPASYVKQGKFLELTNSGMKYMDDDFFKLYRLALEEAKRQGLYFILYDDYYYPSGTVCGQLYQKYPQDMAKRLDMTEQNVTGPARADLSIPKGPYIGAVLMNRDTFERIDVSNKRQRDHLICDVPKGNWKVMAFYLNTDAVLKIRNPGLVDYLDANAVDKFIALSYGRFYEHLKPYFGSVIKMAFFDEPTMHWLDGRTWTASFNSEFEKKYGYSPMKLYPAMWHDIGPETAAARNALFGFRAQLFAERYIQRVNEWCARHGIQLTGHLDQEEAPNPVPINGDLMKAFEHEAIPGVDDIFQLGRSNRGYKIVTSAAFNFDKPIVLAETYAAYQKLDEKTLFQVAMDQYAMGVNRQAPDSSIGRRASNVAALNEYIGRLSYLLQHGRHVSDIAVLYPIPSLKGCYKFADGWNYAYRGGDPPPEIDYQDIGEILYRGLRVDYTYLHPDVFESRCLIRDRTLVLNNKENREEYKILVLPGGKILQRATARKLKEFYDNGGTIIATSRLPDQSAEFGADKDVQDAIRAIFRSAPAGEGKDHLVNHNRAGGRAFFLPKPDLQAMAAILKEALPVRDVDIEEQMWPLETGKAYNGALTYIHKVKDGRDIYFFANSSGKSVNTKIILRGRMNLEIWNPYTGEILPAEGVEQRATTTVRLVLPPVSSLFYVASAHLRH